MKQGRVIKAVALAVFLVIVAALLLGACASGVPQKDYDALKQQLAAKDKELADSKKTSVWNVIPNAPPRAPAPPPSPGATPPPPPVPPTPKTVPLAFYVDTVTSGPGESEFNVDASVGCLRTGVFKRGQRIVWRMEVTDTSTGKVLQGTDVKQAVIKLPHGEDVRLGYGRHGASPEAPWFWAAGWNVPVNYPLGYVNYTIEVTTNDGKVGTYKELALVPADAEALTKTRGRPMVSGGLMIVE